MVIIGYRRKQRNSLVVIRHRLQHLQILG